MSATALDEQPSLHLFGAEVIGRRISLYQGKLGWLPGSILSFENKKHSVRLDMDDSVLQLNLGQNKFKFLSLPDPNEAPNPSFLICPPGEKAVGHKVRVFWPAMGRFYQGLVKSYDAESRKHRIDYCDGDR